MLIPESSKTKCESVSSFMFDLEKARGTEVHAEITTKVRTTKSQGRKTTEHFLLSNSTVNLVLELGIKI